MSGHAAQKGGVQAPYSKPRPRFDELLGDLATDNDLKKEGRARGKKEKGGKEDEERIGLGLYRFITVRFACVCLVPRFVSRRGSLP